MTIKYIQELYTCYFLCVLCQNIFRYDGLQHRDQLCYSEDFWLSIQTLREIGGYDSTCTVKIFNLLSHVNIVIKYLGLLYVA